jgi:hypothetical protein
VNARVGQVEGAGRDRAALQMVELAVDDPQIPGLAASRGDSVALSHEHLGLGGQAQEAGV